jgi:hypothetical protein
MTKRNSTIVVVFTFFLIGIYLTFWAYSANWFKREIDHLYVSAQRDGVQFLGPKPTLTNFPFVPEVHYTGGVKFGNTTLLFAKAMARGFPIPGMTLHISFPEGVQLAGIVDPIIWSLNSLDVKLSVTYNLPRTFTKEDIARWQKGGGKIDIRDYTLTKGSLYSYGAGHFSFDAQLQPAFFMDSNVQGYEAFIDEQKEVGLIDPFASAVGMTILNGLSTHDEASGEREVYLHVSVKNRILTVGPLQVLELPLIVWDIRS